MDRDAMISEVMRRVDIRLGRNDPLWAVIEMNRLLLEESVEFLLERAAPLTERLRSASLQLGERAADSAARSISSDLAAARQKISGEADTARKEAAVAINALAKSHRRDEAMKWFFGGISLAAILAITAFYAGQMSATPFVITAPPTRR